MTRRRILWALAVALAVFAVMSIVPVRDDRIWIDPVSGSLRSQTRWLIFPTTTRVDRSAIERWIVAHEGPYRPGWRHLSTGWRTVFGRTVARGCSLAPEIDLLRHGGLDAGFVRVASDAEVAEFVRVMRMGTASEREQAVDAACQKVLGRPGAP